MRSRAAQRSRTRKLRGSQPRRKHPRDLLFLRYASQSSNQSKTALVTVRLVRNPHRRATSQNGNQLRTATRQDIRGANQRPRATRKNDVFGRGQDATTQGNQAKNDVFGRGQRCNDPGRPGKEQCFRAWAKMQRPRATRQRTMFSGVGKMQRPRATRQRTCFRAWAKMQRPRATRQRTMFSGVGQDGNDPGRPGKEQCFRAWAKMATTQGNQAQLRSGKHCFRAWARWQRPKATRHNIAIVFGHWHDGNGPGQPVKFISGASCAATSGIGFRHWFQTLAKRQPVTFVSDVSRAATSGIAFGHWFRRRRSSNRSRVFLAQAVQQPVALIFGIRFGRWQGGNLTFVSGAGNGNLWNWFQTFVSDTGNSATSGVCSWHSRCSKQWHWFLASFPH